MKSLSMFVVLVTGILTIESASAGGARIVIRQGTSTCYGQPLGGNGVLLLNRVLDDAELVLRNRLGIAGADADTTPVQTSDNERISAIIERLGKISDEQRPAPQVNPTQPDLTLPNPAGRPQPSFFPR